MYQLGDNIPSLLLAGDDDAFAFSPTKGSLQHAAVVHLRHYVKREFPKCSLLSNRKHQSYRNTKSGANMEIKNLAIMRFLVARAVICVFGLFGSPTPSCCSDAAASAVSPVPSPHGRKAVSSQCESRKAIECKGTGLINESRSAVALDGNHNHLELLWGRVLRLSHTSSRTRVFFFLKDCAFNSGSCPLAIR